MSPFTANVVAGNNPAKLLVMMKRALENEDEAIPAGLSVEEEARLKFQRKQAKLEKQKQGGSIVDDFYARKEDLQVGFHTSYRIVCVYLCFSISTSSRIEGTQTYYCEA
jgi:hypothetical protein